MNLNNAKRLSVINIRNRNKKIILARGYLTDPIVTGKM